VERFFEARKMMKNLASGGGIPGMPGMPGAGKRAQQRKKQPQKGKGARKSGNPAKRAQEAQAASEKAPAAANPFGLPAEQEDFDPADFNLPPEVAKYLNQQ
jgi:signal recognition particle subunit SRP54